MIQGNSRRSTPAVYLVLLASAAALLSTYFVVRYRYGWVETDTAALTRAVDAASAEHTLTPQDGFIYANGYAYQSVVLFLSYLSGLPSVSLQRWILPFTLLALPLVFWMLAYEITRSAAASALGSILLFLQPELLFVLIRGSHEQFGRLLMLLCLYLLFKTLRRSRSVSKTILLILLFYLALFAYLSSNFFLAVSFLLAITFAFLSGWLFSVLFPRRIAPISMSSRLFSVASSAFILAYLLAFLTYPPAQNAILVLDVALERLRSLILYPAPAAGVYQRPLEAWGSPLAFLLFNLPNAILLLISFLLWGRLGLRFFRGPSPPRPQSSIPWLLWLLYAAFAFQAILAVLSDLSGMFANLQHRLFPSLSLLAVLLITHCVSSFRFGSIPLRLAPAVLVFLLALLSTLKFTNEPSLVAWWIFFTPAERTALQWAAPRLPPSTLWVGCSARLLELGRQEAVPTRSPLSLDFGSLDPYTSSFIISPPILAQSARSSCTPPPLDSTQAFYHNGDVTIHKNRPASPYQK